ncbi:hypothetical protein TNCV_1052711 [Trichonephila clavipes]|nr:hypothetical protein TNCV_1052711 [Trichonephila clavipes]
MTNLGTLMSRRHFFFPDESRFGLQHQNGRIHVWLPLEERTLAACIRHRHTVPEPGVMQDNARLHVDTECGSSLIRKIFGCCSGLHVHQISHQSKSSGPWLPNDCIVTIRQSLRLICCGIVLKLHSNMYLHMSYLTQCPGV